LIFKFEVFLINFDQFCVNSRQLLFLVAQWFIHLV
jgi:hypothetical protein